MKNDREIRQLWHIAKTYFQRAKELRDANKNHLRQKSNRIAKFYEKAIPTDQHKKELSILVAHLSSAAVRMVTIDERFREDHNYRITPPYGQELKYTQSQARLKKALMAKRDWYIHQMLRDNVAHVERSRKPGNQTLWHARQEAIESMSVEQIFNAIAAVMEKFRTELAGKRLP
ncbi:MAG: hypothetical protein ACE5H0_15350 [Bacteroidota bacterium]